MNWQEQRSMTADELLLVLHRLRLSKAAAARFLDVSSSTMRRYTKGSKAIPVATVLLLRAMLAKRIKPVVPAWTEAWEKRQ